MNSDLPSIKGERLTMAVTPVLDACEEVGSDYVLEICSFYRFVDRPSFGSLACFMAVEASL